MTGIEILMYVTVALGSLLLVAMAAAFLAPRFYRKVGPEEAGILPQGFLEELETVPEAEDDMDAAMDVEVANRLAAATLARSFDALMPQTRQLLTLLRNYVVQRAAAEAVSRSDIRFTQRQLRTALEWHDRTLRRHLGRLVELEYVAVYRSGRGNGRTYQLLDGATGGDAAAASLGLIDPRQLRERPQNIVRVKPNTSHE